MKCGQILTSLFRNRFRVIRLLGKGGFSRTYEAKIWQNMGGNKEPDWEAWCRFGSEVGWLGSKMEGRNYCFL